MDIFDGRDKYTKRKSNVNSLKRAAKALAKSRPICKNRSTLMKKDIHPKYYPKAKVTCACGNAFTVGATVPEIKVEICSKCHPFFTGREQLIDTAGRVERFKARKMKAKPKAEKKARTAKNKK